MTNHPPLPRSEVGLATLMSQVRAARAEVRALRAGRVDHDQLLLARGRLLDAMELYAAELVRRRLPTPPALRDDLRLYREIRVRHTAAGPHRSRTP